MRVFRLRALHALMLSSATIGCTSMLPKPFKEFTLPNTAWGPGTVVTTSGRMLATQSECFPAARIDTSDATVPTRRVRATRRGHVSVRPAALRGPLASVFASDSSVRVVEVELENAFEQVLTEFAMQGALEDAGVPQRCRELLQRRKTRVVNRVLGARQLRVRTIEARRTELRVEDASAGEFSVDFEAHSEDRAQSADPRLVGYTAVRVRERNASCDNREIRVPALRVHTSAADAAIVSGDSELNSDDWTLLQYVATARVTDDSAAVELHIAWSAIEGNANKTRGDTHITSRRTVELYRLAPGLSCVIRGASILGSGSGRSDGSQWVSGEQHGQVELGAWGPFTSFRVQFDGPGGNDDRRQQMTADVRSFTVSLRRKQLP